MLASLALNPPHSELARAGYSFLEGSLRHRNEMVIYEAARAICNLPGVEPQDLAPGVTVLQLFLTSPRSTVKYAAMKTLSEVAMIAPMAVVKCNEVRTSRGEKQRAGNGRITVVMSLHEERSDE